MLRSLGLGGDGDEVEAIRDIENEFDVLLNKDDAATWFTVGDVYRTLLKALPQDARDDPGTWERFGAAICRETGADNTLVDEQIDLLGPTLMQQVKQWFGRERRTLRKD
jgi:hypothetical protein